MSIVLAHPLKQQKIEEKAEVEQGKGGKGEGEPEAIEKSDEAVKEGSKEDEPPKVAVNEIQEEKSGAQSSAAAQELPADKPKEEKQSSASTELPKSEPDSSDGTSLAPAVVNGAAGPVASTTSSTGAASSPKATPAPAYQSPPQTSSHSVPNGLPPGLPTGSVAPANPNVSASLTNPAALVEERGEVSALYVGRVIGKGGEMIRDLQARSGCRIDVDQNVPPGQPRVITYRGTRKTVDFAKMLVSMLCSENASESDLPLGEARREYLIVPAQSVGKIIGRGGEMIRELQSRSQAKIQVDHSGHSGLDNSEKQVTITGTDQAVFKAREMVLFLVANPLMDAMQAINMLVEDKVHRGGVWGSGPPYLNMPNQGQNMQPNSASSGGYGGYDQQTAYYNNAPAPTAPTSYSMPAVASYVPPVPNYSLPVPAHSYQHQAAAPTSYGQYGVSGGVEMEVFYAAKNFMGRIIGQKGVTINDLQRRSATDIQINQDVPPGQDCEISIRGTRQGIETAKQMLREIIEIGKLSGVPRSARIIGETHTFKPIQALIILMRAVIVSRLSRRLYLCLLVAWSNLTMF